MAGPHRLHPQSLTENLAPLYRAARAWTGSRADAEDLVQDTLVHVLARPRLVLGDDLAYLLRALHNTLEGRRRAAARRAEPVELTDDQVGASRRDDPAGVSEDAEVLDAIAELPPAFRDALVAIDVAGLSYKEAARALGVAEGTVTSRLSRARDRLARRLEGEDW
jgi:RNA polymerase sigma-70 factor, ECF subfamily